VPSNRSNAIMPEGTAADGAADAEVAEGLAADVAAGATDTVGAATAADGAEPPDADPAVPWPHAATIKTTVTSPTTAVFISASFVHEDESLDRPQIILERIGAVRRPGSSSPISG
jgi:hypothetical protein